MLTDRRANVPTSSPTPDRVVVVGTELAPTTGPGLRTVLAQRATSAGLLVGYVNPHVLTLAEQHCEVRDYLQRCDHVWIDGIGVWLALRLRGHRTERLPAYRGFEQLLDAGVLRGPTVVIGIEPELIERAANGVVSRGQHLRLAGCIDGFQESSAVGAFLDRCSSSAPLSNIIIGAGSPRSEQLASIAAVAAPTANVFCVGAGTLKVFAGVRRHPPALLSRMGLDWVHRLVREPHTRSRYLRGLPHFIVRSVGDQQKARR